MLFVRLVTLIERSSRIPNIRDVVLILEDFGKALVVKALISIYLQDVVLKGPFGGFQGEYPINLCQEL